MKQKTQFIPVGTDATRVFCGNRNKAKLSVETFYKHLGNTFMPGTPYMLSPLGLSAYLPTVLDIDEDGLPEELALIVYSDIKQYMEARTNSLRRRVYSHSHAGVFDLELSKGQFPGNTDRPDVITLSNGRSRASWYMFDNRIDWQHGTTYIVFMDNNSNDSVDVSENLLHRSIEHRDLIQQSGCDQVICVATTNYGAVWLHHPEQQQLEQITESFVPDNCRLRRSMPADTIRMISMDETIEISGAVSFNFRFLRDEKFFI